jgi:hypothetical protein
VPVIPDTVQVQVTVPWKSLVPSAWKTCRNSSVKGPVSEPESTPVAFAVMTVFGPALREPVGVMLVKTNVPLPVVGAVAAVGSASSPVSISTVIETSNARRACFNKDPFISFLP